MAVSGFDGERIWPAKTSLSYCIAPWTHLSVLAEASHKRSRDCEPSLVAGNEARLRTLMTLWQMKA